MVSWLKSLRQLLKQLFGTNSGAKTGASRPGNVGTSPTARYSELFDQSKDAAEVPVKLADTEAAAFLLALISEKSPIDLQKLSLYDRAYISTMLKKLRTNTFEIPMLPEAASQVQKLLLDRTADAGKFVEVIKNDPALSAELLKIANSVFYGILHPVHDLRLAITRIGLNQIQSLVIMMSLRSRILRGKALQREVEWVTEISMMMAVACQKLSAELAMSPSEAFTLGLLHHVEYFAVLGATAEYISANQGAPIVPEALMEAMRRLGRPLHDLIVKNWQLEGLELPETIPVDNQQESTFEELPASISARLDQLQLILIEKWQGGTPDLSIKGFRDESVRLAVTAVFPETSRQVA